MASIAHRRASSQSLAPDSGFPVLSQDQQKLLKAALYSNGKRASIEASQARPPSHASFPLAETSRQIPSVSTPSISTQLFDNSLHTPTSASNPSAASSRSAFAVPTSGDSFLPGFSSSLNADFDVDLPRDFVEGLLERGNGEKRKGYEEYDQDSEEDDEPDHKRRDGEERVPKKPGRKPLTVEPTTKRKAQNRAAQRAFRERKEQHLKDLEQKITELQRSTRTTNQENSLLRAQVMSLQSELSTYKRRQSLGNGIRSSGLDIASSPSFMANDSSNTSSNPFDFNLDAYSQSPLYSHGVQYGPRHDSSGSSQSSADSVEAKSESRSDSASLGPNRLAMAQSSSPEAASRGGTLQNPDPLFTPSFFTINAGCYNFPQFGSPTTSSSNNSNNISGFGNTDLSSHSQSKSQSSSSLSQASRSSSSTSPRGGPSSSCGTSPEPGSAVQGEHKATQGNAKSATGDLTDFQFEPSLFGDYRETQDAIYGDGDFSGGLYDEFLNMPDIDLDPTTNGMHAAPPAAQPVPTQASDAIELSHDQLDKRQMMTTNTIWKQLKECPKFQRGEIDIDSLCTELSQKATCSESGTLIPKDDWEAALWRLVEEPNGANVETSK